MKRFFTYFLAFTVSLSALSVLLTVPVKAVSPWDNYIENAVPPYELRSFNNRLVSTWDNVEQLIDYIFTDSETRLAQGASFCGNTWDITFFNSLKSAVDAGAPMLIGTPDINTIIVVIQSNVNAVNTQAWPVIPGYDNINSSTPTLALFNLKIANNGNRPICGGSTDLENISTMYAGLLIGSSFPFSLPSPDYEGEIPNPIISASNLYPLISYTVDTDNTLNALSSGVFEDVCVPVGNPTSGCAIPYIEWYVTDEDDNVVNSYTNGLKAPYTFKFPGNGTYYLHATYSLPPPFLAPSPSVVFVTTKIQIDANGTFQEGGTGANECSMIGGQYVCEPANPLEDCSTYGVDLGGYFQCIINNFGIWLRNTLINLFVPSYSFFNNWTTSFGEFLNSKLGFVYSSFALITSLFTGIVSNGAMSSCTLTTTGTLFGAPFSVDICNFQEIVGATVWGIVQGLVISLTILALAFAGYRKYLEIVDHR